MLMTAFKKVTVSLPLLLDKVCPWRFIVTIYLSEWTGEIARLTTIHWSLESANFVNRPACRFINGRTVHVYLSRSPFSVSCNLDTLRQFVFSDGALTTYTLFNATGAMSTHEWPNFRTRFARLSTSKPQGLRRPPYSPAVILIRH